MGTTALPIDERMLTGIKLGESHFREFKSAFERDKDGSVKPRPVNAICKQIAEELVAFANADGGELFIGVEDDGAITGVPHRDDAIERLLDAPRSHAHSETALPTPVARRVVIDKKVLLYFRVTKSLDAVILTAEGRCLQRFDREKRPVPPERIQRDRRQSSSREYDRAFPHQASMDDLDTSLLDEIGNQVAPGYSPEKLLQFLDLAEYGGDGLRLRRAALLLFGKNAKRWHPRCEIRILRVSGTELKPGHGYNVEEDDIADGNIVTILETGWEKLRPYLAQTKFQESAVFRENIIYPEEACREALINAVAHRDYSAEGEPIEVMIFDDRMEIKSPGGLLPRLTVESLSQLEGQHDSRNVFIARVLRQLGYMREMGEGIRRIFTAVRGYDLIDPELHDDGTSFRVIMFHRSVFSAKDVQWLEGYSDFHLSKDEQRVVLLGRDGRLISTEEIMQTLGLVDTEDFRALYEDLRRKGIIYSGRHVTTGRKRKIARFAVRAPQEAVRYLAELRNAVAGLGPTDYFDRRVGNLISDHLSSDNPYRDQPIWSLQALGYLSGSKTPLVQTRSLWPSSGSPQRALVTYKGPRGFAFAQSNAGEEFYLHCSQFQDQVSWDALAVGDLVEFSIGERRIPGKARAGKEIRLVRRQPGGSGREGEAKGPF